MFAWRCSGPAVTLILISGTAARAQDIERVPTPTSVSATRDASDDGLFLPSTLAARVGTKVAFASALGGYDSASKKPFMNATAEVRLWGPIALRGGAEYSTTRDGTRPTVGLRAQLVRQETHGIDGSISIFYRPEGFTEPEGEIETFISLARSWSRVLLVGNLVYGQDPEGRERDAETRVALLHRGRRLTLGFDSRMRVAIQTKVAPVSGPAEPKFDAFAGPLAVSNLGPIALFAQVGPSALRVTNQTYFGVAAMGGVGTAF